MHGISEDNVGILAEGAKFGLVAERANDAEILPEVGILVETGKFGIVARGPTYFYNTKFH